MTLENQGRGKRRVPSVVVAIVIAVATAVGLAAGLGGHALSPRSALAPSAFAHAEAGPAQLSFQLHLPLLLDRSRPETPPLPSPTPTDAPSPTSTGPTTPTATATVTATETPTDTMPGPHGPVVFQIATYGGLANDLMLNYIPSMTPWFTLYEDGHYIRFAYDWGSDTVSRRTGQLSSNQYEATLARLVDEIEFFDLPGRPDPMLCVTDGPHDRVLVNLEGRQHRMVVYGLSGYDPDWSGACPTPPEDRLVLLAEFVSELDEPVAEYENDYTIEQGTLAAVPDELDRDLPDWPVGEIRLADLPEGWPRTMRVEGQVARDVAQALADHSRYSSRVVEFREDDVAWLVGLRVEFDGWDSYGPTFRP